MKPSSIHPTTSPRKALFLAFALTAHGAFAALPAIDFDRMGRVGIAGVFAGLDFFDNSSTTFDPSTSTLFARTSDGGLSPLGATNAGGNIVAGCSLGDKYFFGGSFTTIGSTPAQNVAAYTPSSRTFSALGGANGGLDSEVYAMHCDSATGTVWVGGRFKGPVTGSGGYGGAVALYRPSSDSWSPPPFGGLSGAAGQVLSITPSTSGSSIYFSGSFITAFQSGNLPNGTSNPNVPVSAGATPFTTSLVPIPLSGAEIAPSPSSPDTDFADVNAILCPSGPDGPGRSWFAEDGFKAFVTIRTFQHITVSGIRLGNTFIGGRGTTAFTVTAIPDNNVLTLRYNDPVTGATSTCSERCPLLTDSSIPFQDFLFDTSTITGVQVTLTEWTGDGPGLHLLQLLSDGAFASAVGSQNGNSCFAPNPSSATLGGTWTTIEVNTDIPSTIQPVLRTDVATTVRPSDSPTVRWNPYLSSSGAYNVFLLIPGCISMQDCGRRTSVRITLSPGGGLPDYVTTVSQRVEQDARALFYTGPIFPTLPDFTVAVVLSIADSPEGTGEGGRYTLIADRVEFELTSVDPNGGGDQGTGSSGSFASRRGYGFFEWPSSSTATVNATAILPNTTETALDAAGFAMLSSLGNSSALTSRTTITSVSAYSDQIVFLGGNFSLSGGSSNVISFKGTSLANLNGQGLNGPVSSLVISGDSMYVGGAFTDTVTGGQGGRLSGIARYDILTDQWAPLGLGVNGPVRDIRLANNRLTIAGDFTRLLSSSGTGSQVGGFATWDITQGRWVPAGGLLVGSMSLVTNGTLSGDSRPETFVAGNVQAARKYGADGLVLLQNGDDGPEVEPLGAHLEDNVAPTASPAPSKRWELELPTFDALSPRQSSPTSLPPSPDALAPAVLTGIFWTNTSSSTQVAILGGNFSFPSAGSTARSVAIYDPESGQVTALHGQQVDGVVRSLLIANSLLFVGGQFSLTGGQGQGLAIYDLVQQQWDTTSFQGLQAASGGSVNVRSLSTIPSRPNVVVVAGSFATAGALPCEAICAWDIEAKQWSSLGLGIRGEISSLSFAGPESDLLIAAGALTLTDGTPANVAQYSIVNATWTSLVSDQSALPGPVTALGVNNRNESSVFAMGRSSDGGVPFFSFWNGATWTLLSSSLQAGSFISQMEMVPLMEDHAAGGIIESNRMLLISGALVSSSFGNVSSALYDGRDFHPYLVSSTASGVSGYVAALFHSFSNFSFNHRRFLATGVVILISIAIAAGIVFLLGLLGILWAIFGRRDEKGQPSDAGTAEDDDSLQRPSSLLATVNAATRNTILGTGADNVFIPAHKAEDTAHTTVEDHDESGYKRAETPLDSVAMGATEDDEDVNRPAHARYSFDGSGEGELPLTAGAQVIVLDDRDPAWWYARDAISGREGVVPAAYLY